MRLLNLFINPANKLLRSGWRALLFLAALSLPYVTLTFLLGGNAGGGGDAIFAASPAMIFVYAVIVAWVGLISWLCLRWLEKLPLASLGFARQSGWRGEVICGGVLGALMTTAVVALQVAAGGTRVRLNPVGWRLIAGDLAAAFVLLALAAAFEELLFRGYAFQTLLRGAPALVPLALGAFVFGLSHWSNPSRTSFSTLNTVLAGVWLAAAYLRTRSLWFPTALHCSWNWTMGALFGAPVSGLRVPSHPLLVSTNGAPLWLTGGDYGSEGGAAALLVFALATLVVWRARLPGVCAPAVRP